MRLTTITSIALAAAALSAAQATVPIQVVIAPSRAKQPTPTSVMPAFTGNQILFTGATLKNLVSYAYGWDEFNIAGGPGWAETARYDLVARASVQTNPARFRQSVVDLIEARFAFKSHKETRRVAVYDLVVAGTRPRLTPTASGQSYSSLARGRLVAKRWTMTQFASMLQRMPETGRPVRDKTGVAGEFDIDLQYAGGLAAALEQQLGLRLAPATAPVEYLVIDSATQP